MKIEWRENDGDDWTVIEIPDDSLMAHALRELEQEGGTAHWVKRSRPIRVQPTENTHEQGS